MKILGENAMNNTDTLCKMTEGCRCRVKKMLIGGAMRRRLNDIGLIEGTDILTLNRSPSGDPAAYLIRGAVIALRDEEAEKISVERIN